MAAKRNVSLDLFRVIIMFMIVLGHSLVHGGIRKRPSCLLRHIICQIL